MTALPQVFSLLAYPADVKFIMPLQSHEPIKKKNSLSVYLCMYTHPTGFLSLETLTNTGEDVRMRV